MPWRQWLWCRRSSGALQVPELPARVTTIGIGIDGTCLLMCHEGWREAMVGTISLYDQAGEREHIRLTLGQHSLYGKKAFFNPHSALPTVTWGATGL